MWNSDRGGPAHIIRSLLTEKVKVNWRKLVYIYEIIIISTVLHTYIPTYIIYRKLCDCFSLMIFDIESNVSHRHTHTHTLRRHAAYATIKAS